MSESQDYKKRLGKKVKDMTPAEKREYGRLRTKDSRSGNVKNTGNINNKKMKCFIRTAKNGKPYRACVVPEKNKQPKKQVRGKPRPETKRKQPRQVAYPSAQARTKAQQARRKKK